MMHGYFAGIDADPTQARAWEGQRLKERSHGESFLAVLRHRFADVGVYFLDEPKAALSFRSCLGLLALLAQLRAEGSQVVMATHSPVLAALPGATLLEVGDWGCARWPMTTSNWSATGGGCWMRRSAGCGTCSRSNPTNRRPEQADLARRARG
jgi:predicted ATPase